MDSTVTYPDKYKVVFENEHVRVLECRGQKAPSVQSLGPS